MKRGYNMVGQLSLAFTFDDPQEVQAAPDLMQEAERIIQKYLRVADRVSQYYTYCSERTPNGLDKPGLHPMMRRYYKSWKRVHEAGKRMIESLHLDCEYFHDTEEKYNMARYSKRKGNQSEADRLGKILDGFGYIQQVFDHENRTEERYYEEGEEYDPDNCDAYEDGKPIGYWYWLFEDPIAQIPVPVAIINKYVDKYGEAI